MRSCELLFFRGPEIGRLNFLSFRMPLGDEPAAARAVIPPFALYTEDIFAHVQILGPGRGRRLIRRGALRDFAAEVKFAFVARPAVRAWHKNHGVFSA